MVVLTCLFCFLCATASTRNLYEKRLQKLLNQPPSESTPPEPETAVPETVPVKTDGSQNGNTRTVEDQYSDKEEGSNTLKITTKFTVLIILVGIKKGSLDYFLGFYNETGKKINRWRKDKTGDSSHTIV